MDAHIVVGLGWGDEGKGITTSSLVTSLEKPIVVRFNGGHQAGHTVVERREIYGLFRPENPETEIIRHVFSNFGSGSLHGAPTIWSKYCTFDPIGVYNEYKALQKLGITPKLYVDPDCPVVTSYDKTANLEDSFNMINGTCGVGFGKTLQRHESFYKIHVRDLFYPWILEQKLKQVQQYYSSVDSGVIKYMMLAATWLIDENIFELYNNKLLKENKFENIIFEGAQGIMLDQDYGFFPHVTRSNTTGKNALAFIREEFGYLDITTYYVTRAYQTRHGNGPMSNQGIPLILKNNENETNVTGIQGTFRTSLLDLNLLRYALSCGQYHVGGEKRLVVTCLDQIDGDIAVSDKGYYVHLRIDELPFRLGFKDTELITFDSPITKKLF